MRNLLLILLLIALVYTEVFCQTMKNTVLTNSSSVLVGGEYFINTDPGIEQGTTLSVSTDGKINIPSISLGKNETLYIRVKDSNGRWSPTRGIKYRYKNLTAAAYAIKYSNGTFGETQLMSVANQPLNSTFFVATSQELPLLTSKDTIYVSFYSEDGFWNQWVKKAVDIVRVENERSELPEEFALLQNYPNPFNPTTTIKYSIPAIGTRHAVSVQLKVYDILGKEVAILVNEENIPGNYEVKFDRNNLSSGVYFYRLQAGSFSDSKKFILLK